MLKNVRIYKGLQLPLRSVLGRFGSSYPLFTLVRGRGILRTSPFGDSRKLDFPFTEFYEVRSKGILRSSLQTHRKMHTALKNSSAIHRPMLFSLGRLNDTGGG